MTKEEALKILKDCRRRGFERNTYFVGEYHTARDMAIEALEQTRWIPVSERLPIAGEYVGDVAKYYLVQNEYGDMLVARYTHSEYWEQIYQMKPIADEIVAWMPLPEPYKAESEEL